VIPAIARRYRIIQFTDFLHIISYLERSSFLPLYIDIAIMLFTNLLFLAPLALALPSPGDWRNAPRKRPSN
jgi:hypothetical protein